MCVVDCSGASVGPRMLTYVMVGACLQTWKNEIEMSRSGERRLMNTDWDRLTNTDWKFQSTDWEKEIEMSRSEESTLMNTE